MCKPAPFPSNVNADFSVITGGKQNIAGQFDEDSLTVVVGGRSNVAEEEYSAIVGGQGNATEGTYGFIGGGQNNLVDNENFLFTQYGAIAGGLHNVERSEFNSIIGGDSNLIEDGANFSVLGGGQENTILPNSDHSTIPGGDSLFANGYAQTVVGFHNITSGNVSKSLARGGSVVDTALFIIGNGTITKPSDAFTVSYDGHSSVYQVNGGAGAKPLEPIRPAFVGSTYEDNTIVAWGDIQGGSAPYPSIAIANADFGVALVNHTGLGRYDVILNITNPDLTPHPLTSICVTITAEDAGVTTSACVFGTSTGLTGINTFTIHLHDNNCNAVDNPFFFKVTGR